MTTAEIIILILGVGALSLGFILPDKKSTMNLPGDIDEEAIKAAIREEVDKYKASLTESCENIINDNKSNLERSMDRITNEKMLAISEYSDTVLERIHKNHEEAVFLYDMLNNKHSQIKNTAAEINELEKATKKKEAKGPIEEKLSDKEDDAPGVGKKRGNTRDNNSPIEEKEDKAKKIKPFKALEIPLVKEERVIEPIDLMLSSDGEDSNGEKERIFALHNEGKSNMAIAKELGMGIGEVKLILDLYK